VAFFQKQNNKMESDSNSYTKSGANLFMNHELNSLGSLVIEAIMSQ
jgi:hypothetical protein